MFHSGTLGVNLKYYTLSHKMYIIREMTNTRTAEAQKVQLSAGIVERYELGANHLTKLDA